MGEHCSFFNFPVINKTDLWYMPHREIKVPSYSQKHKMKYSQNILFVNSLAAELTYTIRISKSVLFPINKKYPL